MKKHTLIILLVVWCYCANAQTITTVAGNGTFTISGDGGPATAAGIHLPADVFADSLGNLFLSTASTVRKINASGIITTIGGGGTATADGIPATTASLSGIGGLYIDSTGLIYVVSLNKVRSINLSGIINTIAGTGTTGYSGDGGPATAAELQTPSDITFNQKGELFITHSYHIRKVDTAGIISTIAGDNTPGYSGDGGPATAARIDEAGQIVTDKIGNIYFAEAGNHCIRKIDTAGIISTIAGIGTPGFSGDGGPATAAQLNQPVGIAFDTWGSLYIADVQNNRIRKVDPTGTITTIAGNGAPVFAGDGGPATAASMNKPPTISVDKYGNIFVNDRQNFRVRRIASYNKAPAFTHGALVNIVSCGEFNNIDTILQVIDSNSAQTIVWSVATAPAHGTLSAAYSTLSTGSVLTPSLLSYVPTVGYSGPDTFSVRAFDGAVADTILVAVDVQITPIAAPLSGSDTICVGSTATYTATTAGGVWSSPDATVGVGAATGVVSGISTGTAVISYTVANACGTDTAIRTISILPEGECPTLVATPSQADIRLFPNPGKGTFTLQSTIAATVSITDITGRTIKQLVVDKSTTFSLDVPAGVYIVSVRTAKGVWRERLVVE